MKYVFFELLNLLVFQIDVDTLFVTCEPVKLWKGDYLHT